MNTLNKEQRIAKWMLWINAIIGVAASIPALLCFLFTADAFFPGSSQSDWPTGNSSIGEKLFFAASTILLLVFYGYNFFSPAIFNEKNYIKTKSRNYWLLIIVVNILTLTLFASIAGTEIYFDFSKEFLVSLFVWLPVIPLIIALTGLFANLNLQTETTLNENQISL